MKLNPTSPDKRKEYNKQAYLRRREKLKKDEEEKQTNEKRWRQGDSGFLTYCLLLFSEDSL